MKALIHKLARLFGYVIYRTGPSRTWVVDSASSSRTGLIYQRLSEAAHWEHMWYLLKVLKVDTVLDVGANEGQFAEALRCLGFTGRIASFEPNPDLAEILKWKARHDHQWSVHPIGIGDQNGTRPFNVSVKTTLSSFRSPSKYGDTRFGNHIRPEKTVTVPLRRLDTTLATELCDITSDRVFLKVDTQGFDIEAFRGMGKAVSRIVLLQSELSFRPLYESTHSYVDSLELFESAGFRPAALHPVCTDLDTLHAAEMDCLLVRTHLPSSGRHRKEHVAEDPKAQACQW